MEVLAERIQILDCEGLIITGNNIFFLLNNQFIPVYGLNQMELFAHDIHTLFN